MTSMTAQELRTWLRDWVSRATGVAQADIADDTPMENLGLSSRDVVILSGELETLLGTKLDATIAYQYPTIGALADRLVQGDVDTAEPQAQAAATPQTPGTHDIAIVGMAARFPGAESIDEMWDLLVSGRDGLGELPEGRWSEYEDDDVVMERAAKVSTTGGYLSDIAGFDNEFFGLSPLEAANMDPQQRMVLELTWKALENAHLPANELRGKPVGVFVGSSNNDYGMLISGDPAAGHPYAMTGTASSIIPNRVSYAFDFRGPSVSVDTACSSSLVAVHQAVRALREGDAELAVAGGVNLMATPSVTTAFRELGVLSPTGAIHAFSEDADGFVRAEGAGLVVLKTVDRALADGDDILAVIKGSAVNSDGRSNGLTAPNPDAQVDVLRRAYADAGMPANKVDLIEAHGTGTLLGDPIEARALGGVVGRGRDVAEPALLGSAKTNFGHAESAAGAAGLIKVVLGMVHGVIPPSLHFSGPNPYIDFEGAHLEVVEDPREWPEYSGHPTAGVSGFGFGGTNAHVVVSSFQAEEYEAEPKRVAPQLDDGAGVLLPVSGLLPSRRKLAAKNLADFLEGRDDADLAPVARSVAGYNHGRSRAVVTAASVEEAVKRLRQVAEGQKSQGIAVADAPSTQGPVFVYSGFGSQHRKMAKELTHLSPIFADRMAELDEIIRRESGWSATELIEDDGQTYDTETAQVVITAIQIALTDLLAELGMQPAAVMGMSMGEIAAAYACGGLSAEDALIVACHRARLMGEGEKSLPEDQLGAMAVVEFAAADLAEFIADHPEYQGIEPAVYAGPGMTTVGGPREAVTQLVEYLEGEEKFARLLNVKGAGHTSAVEPLLGELYAEAADIEAKPIRIPLFSSVDEERVYQPGETVHDTDYWLRCTRHPVWFMEATQQAFAAGHSMLVEISPNPVALMGMMNTAFASGKPDAQLLYVLKRKVPSGQSIRELLAKAYVSGQPVNFRLLEGDGDRIDAPGTEFKRARHWTEARPSSGPATGLPGVKVSLPDGRVVFATQADQAPSSEAILEAAAEAVIPGSQVAASEEKRPLPAAGQVTTIVTSHLGGATIAVYTNAGELIAEGFATNLVLGGGAPAAPSPEPVAEPADDLKVEAVRWDPSSGETVADRLRGIVSESMGYDVEDLPAELPLIDLGLDSLMGMRIKNRIENDFQIPPLQVQALRDASVADVIDIVEAAVAGQSEGRQQVSQEQASAASSDRTEVGVAPRDASERLVFATWASLTGAAVPGVTSKLPQISEEVASKIAERLTDRAGVEITASEVHDAEALEHLANRVREGLETEVEGNIRVLRARPEGSAAPALFMFHPAGGSSVVYQPLMRRLPDRVPVYGVERLEGPLNERAAAYLDEIREYAAGHPVLLGGWSFGGALAYEVAHQLVGDDSVNLAGVVLMDTVQPSEPVPDTPEETKARWERYAAFAKKTYGLDFPVPYELLEQQGEDVVLGMLTEFLSSTDAAAHGLSAGVLEHQRASFVDNRILDKVELADWADVHVPVLLFRAERMHDGAIELEPRYVDVKPDGGWSRIVDELEVVQLHGDHLAIVDEPEIGTVAAHVAKRISKIERSKDRDSE